MHPLPFDGEDLLKQKYSEETPKKSTRSKETSEVEKASRNKGESCDNILNNQIGKRCFETADLVNDRNLIEKYSQEYESKRFEFSKEIKSNYIFKSQEIVKNFAKVLKRICVHKDTRKYNDLNENEKEVVTLFLRKQFDKNVKVKIENINERLTLFTAEDIGTLLQNRSKKRLFDMEKYFLRTFLKYEFEINMPQYTFSLKKSLNETIHLRKLFFSKFLPIKKREKKGEVIIKPAELNSKELSREDDSGHKLLTFFDKGLNYKAALNRAKLNKDFFSRFLLLLRKCKKPREFTWIMKEFEDSFHNYIEILHNLAKDTKTLDQLEFVRRFKEKYSKGKAKLPTLISDIELFSKVVHVKIENIILNI